MCCLIHAVVHVCSCVCVCVFFLCGFFCVLRQTWPLLFCVCITGFKMVLSGYLCCGLSAYTSLAVLYMCGCVRWCGHLCVRFVFLLSGQTLSSVIDCSLQPAMCLAYYRRDDSRLIAGVDRFVGFLIEDSLLHR